MQLQLLNRTEQAGFDNLDSLTQRAGTLLDRFESSIRKLEVDVYDDNGPKGGVDRTCRVIAQLHSGSQVVTEGRSTLIVSAIDTALRRLSRQLADKSKRRVSKRRRGMVALES